MEGKDKYIKLTILVFCFALALFVVTETPIGKEASELTGSLSESMGKLFITDFNSMGKSLKN